jgi:hypothetical protein
MAQLAFAMETSGKYESFADPALTSVMSRAHSPWGRQQFQGSSPEQLGGM